MVSTLYSQYFGTCSTIMKFTLIDKIIKLPVSDHAYQIESWDREADTYLLRSTTKDYHTITISRIYLVVLLESGHAKPYQRPISLEEMIDMWASWASKRVIA